MQRTIFIRVIVITLALAGCSPTSGPVPTTATPPNPSATAALPTQAPTTAPTQAPPTSKPPTTGPMTAPTAAPATAGAGSSDYLDDRSSGTTIVRSLYNAINSRQYARAYSYWSPGAVSSGTVPPFPTFEQGYANTASVQVTIDQVTGGVGAGQIYESVPVILVSTTTDNSTQTFAGCYTTHLGQPANYAQPPFPPLAIESATIQPVPAGQDPASVQASACQGPGSGGGPVATTVVTDPNDISPSRYLDDRSTAEEVIRSLYNAVNRREYVRAYSYWSPGAVSSGAVPAYPDFEHGYQTTASVQVTFGQSTSDAGAGQLYWKIPVALVSTMNDQSKQTFVGCYTLHLSRPEIQAAPPFQPMGIESASVQPVANGADTSGLLAQACQP